MLTELVSGAGIQIQAVLTPELGLLITPLHCPYEWNRGVQRKLVFCSGRGTAHGGHKNLHWGNGIKAKLKTWIGKTQTTISLLVTNMWLLFPSRLHYLILDTSTDYLNHYTVVATFTPTYRILCVACHCAHTQDHRQAGIFKRKLVRNMNYHCQPSLSFLSVSS